MYDYSVPESNKNWRDSLTLPHSKSKLNLRKLNN